MVRRSRCARETLMTSEVLSRRDVHRAITDKIVEAIETGAAEYRMPWHRSISRPTNASTGKAYHGVNIIALWTAAGARRFQSDYWATYRQWNQLGAQVRKGERGSMIVFYKAVEPKKESETAHDDEPSQPRLVARTSWAFNAEQVDGWTPPKPQLRSQVEIRAGVERFVTRTRAEIRHGGDRAYYDWIEDYIAVPYPEQFVATETSSATEGYYSLKLHELIHWSGAEGRLARNLRSRFGDHAYAIEELIAEFGAAFLCADLGIANEPRLDHAGYVSSWLKALDQDRTALFTAANKASAASAYLAHLSAPLG
jgi:antirestriction protein ArdC